ncbi:MAG: patatin-like phospholipase family protein [Pseudomonadota bacterium]
MARHHARRGKNQKSINLALQGGGAHGAFTWGVLDKIFEDNRLWIEAISGTSAGAMNAVVASQGMFEGAGPGARQAMHDFWREVSRLGAFSPVRRSFLDRVAGNWSMDNSPGYVFMDLLSRVASPYELNPFNINPLRDMVDNFIDFDKVRDAEDMPIYVAATNVETGRVRVFSREELTIDVLMASACLPTMFQAVEIDGVPYWDGGFMGNPPLFPLIDDSPSDDIVIVQINPVTRPGTPKTAAEIMNRVNEITFNSSLLAQLRGIDFVHRLIGGGMLREGDYRDMKVHIIHSRKRMRPLTASSKMNSEWRFLKYLRDIGRDAAELWLAESYDRLGKESTVNLREMFMPPGKAPSIEEALETRG